jgi:hypothetical protein
MKNIFSASEETPQVDPAFHNQPQAGPGPTAPSCNPNVPGNLRVPLPTPDREGMAEVSAPHSAVGPAIWPTRGR